MDVQYGNTRKAPVAEVFVPYVDLVYKMIKRNGAPGQTEQEMSEVQGHINIFREEAIQLSGIYKVL